VIDTSKFVGRVRPLLLLVLLCAVAGLAAPLRAQEAGRVVRGVVVDGTGAGVARVEVRVTHARSRTSAVATTDSAGRFSAAAPGDGGAYLVQAFIAARAVAQARVTLGAPEREAVVRLEISRNRLVRLDTLRAARRRPASRGEAVGNAQGVLDGQAVAAPGNLAPGTEGNLDALASLVPGVQMTPQGPSVFGLGADQNSRTLNGLNVGDVDLPRDMRSSLQVATSPWDPTRGGFSGAQLAASIAAGGTFATRSASLVVDAPVQRLTDPVLARLGGQGPRTVLGMGGSGELIPGRYYFNAGLSATFARAGSSTLLSSDREALRLSGIHPDSVARLLATLRSTGVALGPESFAGRLQDALSLTVRLDRDPSGPRRTNLLAFGKVEHSDALRQTPRATPGYTGEAWSVSTGVSLSSSHHVWTNYLHEPMLGVTFARREGTPHLALPTGRVLVSSDLDGRQPVLTSVSFGGNSLEEFSSSEWTIQLRDELQWLSTDNLRRRKIFFETALAGFSNEAAANRLGSYEYRSLEDVVGNRPYAFRRQFGSTAAEGRQWTGALAWADSRTAFKKLQLVYGARVDANRFLDAPEANPVLREAFGVRTERMPNRVDVSPRLGFTWSYRPRMSRTTVSSLGSASFWQGGVVQGGIGKFRGALPTTLLDEALRGTGLPGGLRELTCLGSAVPAPDWRGFLESAGSIPRECAPGQGGTLTDISPRAQLLGAGFDAPHSWRASLGWSSSFGKAGFGVDATRSWNRSVASREDLNFAGTQHFALAAEGGRPVFVPVDAIAPASGATSAAEARVRRELGRVEERSSDLSSSSWQLTGRLTPDLGWKRRLSASYTLAGARGESRGFDGTAFGDPRRVETARGPVSRHQFMLHSGVAMRRISVALYGRLASGVPFTPTVAGDVNGDGTGLDRAFVFDPSTVRDPALATGMSSVLGSVPAYARGCLRAQLGTAAARNSCTGPWTQSLDASVIYNSIRGAFGRRVNASLYLANLPGAADQLLHGSRRLRGWGTQPFPDPVLYTVRGFDPGERAFRYEINPRFGEARSTLSSFGSPFRVTLDVRLNLGKSQDRQAAERIVRVARTFADSQTVRPEEVMKLAFPIRMMGNTEQVIGMRETLALTPEQLDSLRTSARVLHARADSMKLEFSRQTARAGRAADVSAIVTGRRAVEEAIVKMHKDEIPFIRRILNPAQVELLPPHLRGETDMRMFTSQPFKP
jgi:hypothetical protein